jgi:tight adherence protein B
MDDELQILIPTALAAGSIALVFAGLRAAVRSHRLHERMRDYVLVDAPVPLLLRRERRDEFSLPAGMTMTRRLSRSSLGVMLRMRVIRAGLAFSPSELILIQAAAACVAALLGFVVTPQAALGVRLPFAGICAAVGFVLPLLVLGVLERRRIDAFERQLPQAIDAMAGSLQAGSSLPQAMEIIAREMPVPIAAEFRRVLREVELGLSLAEALVNAHVRTRSTDLELLSSAVAIQQRVGGDLAEIFRGISHTVRERLRIRSEIRVLTSQGRYSAYLITALPILLFCYLWLTNYGYISQLFLPGITRLLFYLSIAGIVVGYFIMNRIVNVDV